MDTNTNLALPAAPAAHRFNQPRWLRGRVILGALLVAAAVAGGAALLRSADATSTVLAASRDLPSGVPLEAGDLRPVRVRLPDAQLATYATPDGDLAGARLAAGLPEGALVPAAWLLAAGAPTGLTDYPVPVEPGDVPELRPGDRVTVLASYPPGVNDAASSSEILLPSAEVVRLLHDRDGLGGGTRVRAVQLRVPSGRLASVAQAVATGRISMARLSPGDLLGARPPDEAAAAEEAGLAPQDTGPATSGTQPATGEDRR
jgi:Flp pilus assembly protein CpaB